MLNFEQIAEYFEPALTHSNPKGLVVEYLQYEVLDSIFKRPGSEKLSFIGGTAIRMVHGSRRFSEDLDFDNFGLSYPAFERLFNQVCAELQAKGLLLEKRFLRKEKVFHCYLKFPDILKKLAIPSHRDEKIFVSIDAEQKPKQFTPEVITINRFGVYRKIRVNPAPILLSQKLKAILFRKREKGRDFYDASFLAGKTAPDFNFIKKSTSLAPAEFKDKLTRRCRTLNYRALLLDVEPFLFGAEEAERILSFRENLPKILTNKK
jgi:predicted nucleotidyltransferase component of viral defense system